MRRRECCRVCDSTAMKVVKCASASEIAEKTSTKRTSRDGDSDALKKWDDNGNGRISCAEARSHGIAPVSRGHPAYPYMRDGDGDGVVCE